MYCREFRRILDEGNTDIIRYIILTFKPKEKEEFIKQTINESLELEFSIPPEKLNIMCIKENWELNAR